MPNRRRTGARALFTALAPALVLMLAVTGCGRDEPLNEPQEAFEMVEVDYGRAIRLSLAEVTGGELMSLELLRPTSSDPVWESEVATQQGELRTVRLDATSGDVLETVTPPARSSAEQQETRELLDEATVLPGEAAREAQGETDGPVTAVELQEQDGEPVWSVDVTGVDGEDVTTHLIDARTGEVLRRASS